MQKHGCPRGCEWLRSQYESKPGSQIARENGWSERTIYKWLAKCAPDLLREHKYKSGRRAKYGKLVDSKWLRQKYINEKLSQEKIAKLVGCKPGAVSYFLYKHEIPTRTYLEACRLRGTDQISAENHWNWKGGRIRHSAGYILVRAVDHPDARHRGYILEHRLVMEKKIGRRLKRTEVVHHINGDKADNRIENLAMYDKHIEHKKDHKKLVLDNAELRTEVERLKEILDNHSIDY